MRLVFNVNGTSAEHQILLFYLPFQLGPQNATQLDVSLGIWHMFHISKAAKAQAVHLQKIGLLTLGFSSKVLTLSNNGTSHCNKYMAYHFHFFCAFDDDLTPFDLCCSVLTPFQGCQ